MEDDMDKQKCTPGVYLVIGERGVRIGQSSCMETRVSRVRKEHANCIGKTKRVLQIPVISGKERLILERNLIKALDPRCNIQGKRTKSSR